MKLKQLLFIFSLLLPLCGQDLRKLMHTADSLLGQFQYDKAAAYYMKAGEYSKKKKYYSKSISLFNKAANALIRINRFDAAKKILDQSMLDIKRFETKNDSLYASTHIYYGLYYMFKGELDKSERHMEKSYQVFNESGKNKKSLVLLSVYLINIYSQKYKLWKAIEIAESGLDIAKSIYPSDNINFAYLHHNLGAVLEQIGDKQQALEHYKPSLRIYQKQLRSNHPYIAALLNNIGVLYNYQNAYREAIHYLERALRIYQFAETKNWAEISRIYSNLATSYVIKLDFGKAEAYINKAIALFSGKLGSHYTDYIKLLMMKAEIEYKAGKIRDSKSTLNEAISLANSKFDEDNIMIAEIHTLLSMNYLEDSANDSALVHLKRSTGIFNKMNLLHHYRNLENRYLQAKLFIRDKRYDNALNEVNKSLVKNQLIKGKEIRPDYISDPLIFINALKLKTKILELQNKKNEAQRNREILLSFIENFINEYDSKESRLSLIEKLRPIYDEMISEVLNSENNRTEFFSLLSRIKSMGLFSEIRYNSYLKNNLNERDKKELDRLHSKIFYYKKSLKAAEQSAEFKDSLFNLIRKKNILEEKYKQKFKSFNSSKKISIKDLQENLDRDELILDFYQMKEEIIVLSIEKSKSELKRIKINTNHLNKKVNQFLTTIKKLQKKQFKEVSEELFRILFFNNRILTDSKKKVFVIPDGLLHYLPFEALIMNNKYLVEKTEFVYKYSSKSLKESDTTKDKSFLGFAPVRFTDESLKEKTGLPPDSYWRSADALFPDLKETLKEVSDISRLFINGGYPSKIFTYESANKSNFIDKSNKYSIIHLATHSFMNPHEMENSGIIFSGKPKFEILYSSEVDRLNIAADLLVLSSCETGLGKLVKSEGLISLSRAFYYSGLENILFSLWKVYDKPSRELMLHFYRFYLDGKSFSEALRFAKIEMIKNNVSSFPVNWAAFILISK